MSSRRRMERKKIPSTLRHDSIILYRAALLFPFVAETRAAVFNLRRRHSKKTSSTNQQCEKKLFETIE